MYNMLYWYILYTIYENSDTLVICHEVLKNNII